MIRSSHILIVELDLIRDVVSNPWRKVLRRVRLYQFRGISLAGSGSFCYDHTIVDLHSVSLNLERLTNVSCEFQFLILDFLDSLCSHDRMLACIYYKAE
jgi:hypothetical protein